MVLWPPCSQHLEPKQWREMIRAAKKLKQGEGIE